ncbi:hypothetical protein O6H91_18G080700 [Diphasiastrum complanatum]|uniref:Uncharacterized protein n=1 Tax=Diphasiastrum complanatum TaxID=34168 RepID=A0ACC2B373_DIPCM|nr:hypothetical protein O6H91_18G080700 [Diphasiastrum complanatum]
MHQPGSRTVSLRGSSAKEVTRDALLERVSKERASRYLVRKTIAAAALIQRIWRRHTAAAKAADQVRVSWDKTCLEGRNTFPSAEYVSTSIVRPFLFFMRNWKSLKDQQSRLGSDMERTTACFRLLLKSIGCDDPRRNFCCLAVGSEEEKAQWMYQVHKLFDVCCTILAGDRSGAKVCEEQWSLLLSLTVKLMVTLSDANMWKGLQDGKEKAYLMVFRILDWLAEGNAGLYQAARAYLLLQWPVNLDSCTNLEDTGGKDKLIITASVITLMLRPLVTYSQPASKNQDLTNLRVEMESAEITLKAAEQLCKHILTIPFLTQRLPAVFLPAFQHASALRPCLQVFACLQANLSQGTGAFCSPSSHIQIKYDPNYEKVPLSAWALANVVVLSSKPNDCSDRSQNFSGHFLDEIDYKKYVQALCNLLKDLIPWIEITRQQRKARFGEDEEDSKSADAPGNSNNNMLQDAVLQSFIKQLRPVHQRWHLVELLEVISSERGGCYLRVDMKSSNTEAGQATELSGLLEFPEIAELYGYLLTAFITLNSIDGALPILNLLAFTSSLLPALWLWLQNALKLGNHYQVASGSITSDAGQQIVLNNEAGSKEGNAGKSAGNKWASAFLKMGTKAIAGDSVDTKLGLERQCMEAKDLGVKAFDWDLLKGGPQKIPEEAASVLLLFCAAYAHLLLVLDDEEFYEHQAPFSLEHQRTISAMLNSMVYHGFFSTFRQQYQSLMEVACRCLRLLYERDCRRTFCPSELWLAPAMATWPHAAAAARAHELASASVKSGECLQVPALGSVLITIPHVFPFEERVQIFREFIRADKVLKRMGGEAMAPGSGSLEVSIRRDHIVEDGFRQLNRLGSKLKSNINVSFVNEHGLQEAGLDYGGLFKEFLTDLAKAAFDPGYGLFVQTATDEGLLFPHPAAGNLGYGLQMIEFLGKIVGKALYEGILLEYSFSPIFVSKLLGRNSFLEELSGLDFELHRNLIFLKHYEGNAKELALDFTVTEENFGKRTTVELVPGGSNIAVTNENKLQYVHAMADYKLNRQMRPIINAFISGLGDLITPSWLGLFNAKEFNQLLSGGESDFDMDDLRANTRYTGGFTDSSRTIKLFWEVVRGLEPKERCDLLKFVTSCSRAPLLGFKHLNPPFTIHKEMGGLYFESGKSLFLS